SNEKCATDDRRSLWYEWPQWRGRCCRIRTVSAIVEPATSLVAHRSIDRRDFGPAAAERRFGTGSKEDSLRRRHRGDAAGGAVGRGAECAGRRAGGVYGVAVPG